MNTAQIIDALQLIEHDFEILPVTSLSRLQALIHYLKGELAEQQAAAQLQEALRLSGTPPMKIVNADDIVEDGYGSAWGPCPTCGTRMQVIRPGNAQCPKCG